MSRKIILNLCTSLDSYIEGENGEIDWCFTDQDYSMTEFLERIDTIFIGRVSFEQLQREAPNAFGDKQMVVFSRSLQPSGQVKVIGGNILQEVEKIKASPGKDIWLFGGADLAREFLNLDLVDELMISIHPLLLGKGKPLFSDVNGRKKLTLTDTRTFSTGLVQLFYEVKRE